ncbi:low molecular weight protein arginine phosphatase [Cohnella nanjingensis]|uniref:Low molecular weight protein arginine phosphatase n=1 Tax=Cohnella nanjingensis TaxID=1387779 RepID=A0A7X0RM05_9BACL|nr:low molecular weight protein arginine phosphatase [Cohnella nanjingensis]MBB6669932.1 low molecular weight protein arginine phosphatase [Cohnella nanjingensis]
MQRILLVCTGNTCRSPMAEAMLRAQAARDGLPLEVRSAGVAAASGMPISSHAAKTLRQRNVALPGHATPLTGSEVAWADVILTMTGSHKRAIVERYPDALSKTHTLMEFSYRDHPVMEDIAEAERIYTEWQMQHVLGKPLSDADRAKLQELERRLPSFDIADPFGGPLEAYEACAEEIREALERAFRNPENH